MGRGFSYKMPQIVQIATTLLQNATVITNCDGTIITERQNKRNHSVDKNLFKISQIK